MSTLFEECLNNLKGQVVILTKKAGDKIFEKLENKINIGSQGVIWKEYSSYLEVKDPLQILNFIDDENCYIIWDEASIPVLKSSVDIIVKNIEDVLAVSFDTYLVDISFKWIVEFNHEGQIRMLYLN